MEERVRSLLAMTNSLREVEARGKTAVILPLQLSDLRELIAALSCVICKGDLDNIFIFIFSFNIYFASKFILC